MRTGAFRNPNAPLLHLTSDAVNVSLLGYGATIRMRRLDYMNTSIYPAGEGRHTLSIRGSRCVYCLFSVGLQRLGTVRYVLWA